MDSISKNEIEIINKFFRDFNDSVVGILSGKFDSDNFKNIKFDLVSTSQQGIEQKLPENSALYKFNYSVGTIKGDFLVSIPEKLIAIASDLTMGGDGKDVYDGTLSELEINASLNLFSSVLDDMKITFKSLYVKELEILKEPEIILKSMPAYTEMSKNPVFDLSMIHSLNLGEDMLFDIGIFASASVIKQLLINLELLEDIVIPNITKVVPQREMDGIADISKISDIRINIAAELGRIKISLKQVLGLVGGSIIELDTYENSDIKVFANGLEVARAQVVVVDDHFGIKITKIISPEERYKDL